MPHTVEICSAHFFVLSALMKANGRALVSVNHVSLLSNTGPKNFLLMCDKDTRKIPARKQARHALTDS